MVVVRSIPCAIQIVRSSKWNSKATRVIGQKPLNRTSRFGAYHHHCVNARIGKNFIKPAPSCASRSNTSLALMNLRPRR